MLLRHKIVRETINLIKSDPNFREVYEIARKNAQGPVYLVGGRVYRRLIEIIHGYDCAASKSDWDFLVLGKVRGVFIPEGWSVPIEEEEYEAQSSSGISIRNKAVKANSLTLINERLGVLDKVKIDIIAIKDIVIGTKSGHFVASRFRRAKQEKQFGLKEYFDAVPLDIQAIALDLEAGDIHASRALKAIQTKTLRVNNPKGALPDLNIGPYIDRKATSLRFKYDYALDRKVPCTCFKFEGVFAAQSLFNNGCQLPKQHC